MEPSTKLVSQHRNETVAISGYGQYRKTCSQKLLQLRRKLKIATPRGKRYEPRSLQDISAEDYQNNDEWREYLLFSAERAWAHAMDVKSLHTGDSGETSLSGQVRSHVLSRLAKACKAASHLVNLSRQIATDEQSKYLLLAHGAYWRLLEGVAAFESHKWEKSLRALSESHVIYTALDSKQEGTFYRDWITENIEPSTRYAAYQLRLPRTLAVEKVVARHVDKDSFLVKEALKISPDALSDSKPPSQESTALTTASQDLPSSISWRGRTVKLEDARIAQALAGVKQAEETLSKADKQDDEISAVDRATAYEEVLGRSQDAVDATKAALDELAAEGVATSDSRMQSLQITRTAVNYDLIGWRIGRNRVLCGGEDGLGFEEDMPRATKNRKPKKGEESNGKKMARLRSRVVLYDATLDSLDSIRELPGVAADQDLLSKVASRKAYFGALRSLAIARSHALLGNSKNALALLSKASQSASAISTTDDGEPALASGATQHYLSSEQAQLVKQTIEGLKVQFQALVELDSLSAEAIATEKSKAAWSVPLIETLDEYPAGGADLSHLVSYPPKLRPVPVNPILIDSAWNYIDYPGQEPGLQQTAPAPAAAAEPAKPAKRGWFGFGS